MNEKSRGGRQTGSWIVYSEHEAEQEYMKTHSDYSKTKKNYEELIEKKEKLERRIRRRENFLEILTKCQKRIAKYIKVA
jgi:pyruvate-formate lyase